MRISVAILVLVCSVALVPTGPVAAATAAEVLGWCRSDSPEQSAELCGLYVGAIVELAAKPDRIEDNIGAACIPESVTIEQLIQLVVERVELSPDLASKKGFNAIAPVFVKKFPC